MQVNIYQNSGPQDGISSSHSTQPRREAAFFDVSMIMGLDHFLTETYLLEVSGREFSAAKFLPYDFQNLNEANPQDVHRLLVWYLHNQSCDVYRWAAMDYVLGNPDRNAGNVMVRGSVLKLIDHGSALANEDFRPSSEGSFVPVYLRLLSSGFDKTKPNSQKLASMPRVSETAEKSLRQWVDSVDEVKIINTLTNYGIPPQPCTERLRKIKNSADPIDATINALWLI